jgi:hypothetical protein
MNAMMRMGPRAAGTHERIDPEGPFMGPWAAETLIARNGANLNFVFRVSAVDEILDRAMVRYVQSNYQTKRPGVIVVNNKSYAFGPRSRGWCRCRPAPARRRRGP